MSSGPGPLPRLQELRRRGVSVHHGVPLLRNADSEARAQARSRRCAEGAEARSLAAAAAAAAAGRDPRHPRRPAPVGGVGARAGVGARHRSASSRALLSYRRLRATPPACDEPWRAFTTLFAYVATGYEAVTVGAIALFGWLLERRHGWWAPLLVFVRRRRGRRVRRRRGRRRGHRARRQRRRAGHARRLDDARRARPPQGLRGRERPAGRAGDRRRARPAAARHDGRQRRRRASSAAWSASCSGCSSPACASAERYSALSDRPRLLEHVRRAAVRGVVLGQGARDARARTGRSGRARTGPGVPTMSVPSLGLMARISARKSTIPIGMPSDDRDQPSAAPPDVDDGRARRAASGRSP